MKPPHHHTILVRFGDCDPAGVVYFPRYFDWFHQAMESWFDEQLGIPYAKILERYGFPAVHTEADFLKPSRMGEQLDVQLRVSKLGKTSFQIDYQVFGAQDQLRVTGHTVVAMIGLVANESDHFQPVRLPEELRTSIERFVSAGANLGDI